jgi:Rrf2 family protein
MRISAKGEYAIRAMLDLAVHYRQRGPALVPIQDVARRQAIPQRYLEQVLLLLKRAGLLASKRGSTGGYHLVRSPGEISVGEVLRVIEGGLTPLEVAGRTPRAGRDGGGRDLAELWQEIGEAVAAVIDRTTFEDLAERAARRAGARAMYHI